MTEDTPQTRASVEAAIRKLIVDLLVLEDRTPESLPADEPDFLTALGANSIDSLEIIISVEEHFDIAFADQDLRPDLVMTLNGFVDEVCHHVRVPSA